MAWIVLLASAVLEAVWATSLGYSEGFTQIVPTTVFLVTVTLSMLGLGWAAKVIPIGTAYAVWTGVGAALTVLYAVAAGDEPFSAWKAVFLIGIIGAVIGLKLVPSPLGPKAEVTDAAPAGGATEPDVSPSSDQR